MPWGCLRAGDLINIRYSPECSVTGTLQTLAAFSFRQTGTPHISDPCLDQGDPGLRSGRGFLLLGGPYRPRASG
jgi:hypothetical protein